MLLFLKPRNRSLGTFFLAYFAIITTIPPVVGFSISTLRNTGSMEIQFDYPVNISILNVADLLATLLNMQAVYVCLTITSVGPLSYEPAVSGMQSMHIHLSGLCIRGIFSLSRRLSRGYDIHCLLAGWWSSTPEIRIDSSMLWIPASPLQVALIDDNEERLFLIWSTEIIPRCRICILRYVLTHSIFT